MTYVELRDLHQLRICHKVSRTLWKRGPEKEELLFSLWDIHIPVEDCAWIHSIGIFNHETVTSLPQDTGSWRQALRRVARRFPEQTEGIWGNSAPVMGVSPAAAASSSFFQLLLPGNDRKVTGFYLLFICVSLDLLNCDDFFFIIFSFFYFSFFLYFFFFLLLLFLFFLMLVTLTYSFDRSWKKPSGVEERDWTRISPIPAERSDACVWYWRVTQMLFF